MKSDEGARQFMAKGFLLPALMLTSMLAATESQAALVPLAPTGTIDSEACQRGTPEEVAAIGERIRAISRATERIDKAKVRERTRDALATAQAAFTSGCLNDVEDRLTSLSELGMGEDDVAFSIWSNASIARALSAAGRQAFDVAEAIDLKAAESARTHWHQPGATAARFLGAAMDVRISQGAATGDMRALERAVSIGRDLALPLLDQTSDAEVWARIHDGIGRALVEQANGGGGASQATLLRNAIGEFDLAASALKSGQDRDWMRNQMQLAIALELLGERTNWADPAMLAKAIAANRNFLSVTTATSEPVQWPISQLNLAAMLEVEAMRRPANEQVAGLRASLAAADVALVLFDPAQNREAWVKAQIQRARTMALLGQRLPEAGSFLDQSVAAAKAAIETADRSTMPTLWAGAQHALGNALIGQAEHGPLAQRDGAVTQAAAAFEKELSAVGDRWNGYPRAVAQLNLANVYGMAAQRASGAEAIQWFKRSIASVEQGIASLPADTAASVAGKAQMMKGLGYGKLAMAYRRMNSVVEKQQARPLLLVARNAFETALSKFTLAGATEEARSASHSLDQTRQFLAAAK